ncbi:MAG: hypothetical protein AAF492_31450, partial [Verrucomicrobiota bacterium]
MKRRRKIIFAVILVLLPFVLLELGMRWLGFGGAVVYKEHPTCGYRPIPNQRFETFGRPIRILNTGFRGPVQFSRLLCIGDSVTYGTARVGDFETFPALLNAMNAGVNGWGLQNVAAYVKDELPGGIRTVVWVIPTTDILRPFGKLRGGLIATNRPIRLRLEYLFRFLWYGYIATPP